MTLGFRLGLLGIIAGFTSVFAVIVVPPLAATHDLRAAVTGGIVDPATNPYGVAYIVDALTCWWVLACWVIYERSTLGIRRGWVSLVLGLVPGVAVGFAAYLLIRQRRQPRSTP